MDHMVSVFRLASIPHAGAKHGARACKRRGATSAPEKLEVESTSGKRAPKELSKITLVSSVRPGFSNNIYWK